jgi:hypothetical protein
MVQAFQRNKKDSNRSERCGKSAPSMHLKFCLRKARFDDGLHLVDGLLRPFFPWFLAHHDSPDGSRYALTLLGKSARPPR